MAKMILTVGRNKYTVQSLKSASNKYQKIRDDSGLGASKFPDGRVSENGKTIARISYNGNVWKPSAWHSGDKPILKVSGYFG